MATLDVLGCTACGTPLVLADGDAITCPACGVRTPVPEAYRELTRARRDDQALRADAERLLRTLDRPPSIVVKVLARVLDLPMLAFVLLYGTPIMLFAILEADKANRWIAPRLHLARPDDVPFGYMVMIATFLLLVMAFIPRAFGVYANRRVTARGQLLASLRAVPPKVAGGASTCRVCGAPLFVADGALVATCAYCRAENALVIETSIVATAKKQVGALGRTIAEVAERDREDRRATLQKLATELGRYTLRALLLGGGFFLGSQETPEKKPTTIAIVALVATVLLFIYFVIRSGTGAKTDDAAERRAGNDVPGWVSIVGPLVMAYLLFKLIPFVA